jgi:hypothetical protein
VAVLLIGRRSRRAAPPRRRFNPALFETGLPEIIGVSAITEAQESIAATGEVAISALANITEAADTLAATAEVAVAGAAAITEAAESVTGAGEVSVAGQAAIQEVADALSAAGEVAISASAAISEAADTLLATGAVDIVGQASIQEQADSLASAGEAAIAGAAAIQEAADALEAAGGTGTLATGGHHRGCGYALVYRGGCYLGLCLDHWGRWHHRLGSGSGSSWSGDHCRSSRHAKVPDTLAATIGEVIIVEPTPAGDGGRRRKRRTRRRPVEDQDELYQYAEPEKPKAPPPDPTPPVVYISPPPRVPPINLPEVALSKGFEIPYYPLGKQQTVPDVRPEKALVALESKSPAKPERKPINRANLMKAIAVAMLMLEDEWTPISFWKYSKRRWAKASKSHGQPRMVYPLTPTARAYPKHASRASYSYWQPLWGWGARCWCWRIALRFKLIQRRDLSRMSVEMAAIVGEEDGKWMHLLVSNGSKEVHKKRRLGLTSDAMTALKLIRQAERDLEVAPTIETVG